MLFLYFYLDPSEVFILQKLNMDVQMILVGLQSLNQRRHVLGTHTMLIQPLYILIRLRPLNGKKVRLKIVIADCHLESNDFLLMLDNNMKHMQLYASED